VPLTRELLARTPVAPLAGSVDFQQLASSLHFSVYQRLVDYRRENHPPLP